MMYDYGYGYGMPYFSYGIFHLLSWIFWIAVIVIIFKAIRARKHGKSWKDWYYGHDSAMNLLRERYVKGEIDRAEYEAKKKDLTN